MEEVIKEEPVAETKEVTDDKPDVLKKVEEAAQKAVEATVAAEQAAAKANEAATAAVMAGAAAAGTKTEEPKEESPEDYKNRVLKGGA